MQLGIAAASALLLLSVYAIGYPLFQHLGLTAEPVERMIRICVSKAGGAVKLDYMLRALTLYFVFLFLYGNKARHFELERPLETYLKRGVAFTLLFVFSNTVLLLPLGHVLLAALYITLSLAFFYLMCRNLFVYIAMKRQAGIMTDRFNEEQEEFDQVATKIGDGRFSIHIPALTLGRSATRERKRIYWNIVNPFAGTSVTGNPGTGKSFVFINEYIRQCLLNGFTACIYDYKLGELTDMAYRYLMMNSRAI